MAIDQRAAAGSRPATILGVAWRVLVVAVFNLAFMRLLGLLMGTSPTVQDVVLELATGALYAAVLMPLARRLPYRRLTRIIALFVPLYWIAYLSNLVEAGFNTTISRGTLIGGAIFFAIPAAVTCVLIAWLFPAAPQQSPVRGIWESLGDRPILSWVWRVAVMAVLYAVLLQLFGSMYAPLISKYYHDPAFMAQVHTVPPPDYIAWPEETARGVLFVLSLLPVLAVVRGRDWPAIAYAALYITLIGVCLEAWQVFAMTTYPIGFRTGELLDLTTDAVARGILVAALLVLPAVGARRHEGAVALT
jgi:hypothetical protein